jgi:hypothetical protein
MCPLFWKDYGFNELILRRGQERECKTARQPFDGCGETRSLQQRLRIVRGIVLMWISQASRGAFNVDDGGTRIAGLTMDRPGSTDESATATGTLGGDGTPASE